MKLAMLNLRFDPFPEINTARLHLRRLSEADAAEVFFLRSDPGVMQYIDRPRASRVEDAIKYIHSINESISKNEALLWGVTLAPNEKVIGYICLWKIELENCRCEIGYVLHSDYHRKGVMTEALIAVLKHCFEIMELHSIVAQVNPENIASISLLKSLGFVQEAYFKENYFFNGRFMDTAVFTLLEK